MHEVLEQRTSWTQKTTTSRSRKSKQANRSGNRPLSGFLRLLLADAGRSQSRLAS